MTDNALVILENGNPKELFAINGLDEFINKIRQEVADSPKDISTDKSRKEIASLAYKIAKSKTALEKLGKESIEDLQKTVKAVTAERIRGVNALQEIQDKVRQPLTDWEDANKARIAEHESRIKNITTHGEEVTANWQTMPIMDMAARLDWLKAITDDFEEFRYKADEAIKLSIECIELAAEKRKKYDEEQAELKRLREENAARKKKEHEIKIANEAAERAKLEAERLAKIELDRVEKERQEAISRAVKAESDRVAAEKKAQEEKLIAAAKAEKERQEAIESEKKRQVDELSKIAAETAKREADVVNKKKIHNEILQALVVAGLTEELAKIAVTAIAKNLIPHVKINY